MEIILSAFYQTYFSSPFDYRFIKTKNTIFLFYKLYYSQYPHMPNYSSQVNLSFLPVNLNLEDEDTRQEPPDNAK